MAHIVVVEGNPKSGATLTRALATAYVKGAEDGGHMVLVFHLADMKFDPILHDGFSGTQDLEPDLQAAQEAIGAAEHLVFIWPLWLGTMPALLKGFIERIFQPGFGFDDLGGKSGWPKQLLGGKSARIVMTMGMPGIVYRFWYGAHALKVLKRNILGFCGVGPIRSTIYGMVEMVDDDKRISWLAEMEDKGRRGV